VSFAGLAGPNIAITSAAVASIPLSSLCKYRLMASLSCLS
jgi:hypothetical protein